MSGTPRHKLRLLAAALCAAALVAAGCGGSDYKSKVEDAAKGFKQSSQKAGQKLRAAKSKQQFASGVAQFQSAVKTFNGKLQKLDPPSSAKAAQARLISVLNTFSGDVGAVRDALNKDDVSKIQQLQGKVVSDVGAVQSAAKELQDKAD
jgi:uncharacterized phage infection (PIP) family protein YhgE